MALFEAEERIKPFFIPSAPLELDESKQNILIYLNHRQDEFHRSFGYFNLIVEALEESANVIVISDKGIGKTFKNHLKLSIPLYAEVKAKYKRKAEDPNNTETNSKALLAAIKMSFENIRIDKFIITDDMVRILPLTTYVPKKENEDLHFLQNEFHDYTGTDVKRIKDIKHYTDKIDSNFDGRVSILAFSMWKVNLYYNIAKYLQSTGDLKELQLFTMDPTGYSQHFRDLGIKVKEFYFADDKRGTRDLTAFPIGELQHLIFDDKWNVTPKDLTKTKDFIFAGTVLQSKGKRLWVWENFIKDLNLENSTLYIPIKANGIYRSKRSVTGKNGKKNVLKAEKLFNETIEEIKNHKSYGGYVFPYDLPKETASHKYGFVARCVSFFDSLNYRPAMYVNLDVLPILDYYYDPSYLQIPKEIQDRIVVHDSNDIEARVKYFNEHEDERIEIINKLKDHFKFNHIKDNWKDIIKEKILND